ncbi:MAG: hypothetical protein JF627_04985 [Alphaproteobacteria bacterium]|nr:hypothetical protein [Alphaproteobacteria bacterium]
MMLSGAPPRHTRSLGERAQGAVLALLVQAGFLAMILLTPQHRMPLRTLARETILILHPTLPPSTIDARAPRPRSAAPPLVPPPPPFFAPVTPAPTLAPSGGIAGFGRSLFGCAPEHYADLPPDERAHCPKPGEGMAVNQPPDLLNPPKSHSRDEAIWQEQWTEDHWVPALCPPTNGPPIVTCVLRQAIAENHRRDAAWKKIADDKAARLQEPKRPPPKIGVRRN